MISLSRLPTLLGVFILSIALLPTPTGAQDLPDSEVLVFSKTNGYRHEAIPDGIQMMRALGQKHGFRVEATEDSTAFRPDRLSDFDAVVFLNTSGDVLGPVGQDALRNFIRDGGGYLGIHAASTTEYDWSWYGGLVGAYFDDHPEIQEATVRIEAPSHPSTVMLSATWERRDEWYNFRSNPRDSVRVLLTLDETTYKGGTMGDDHPLAWCHVHNGGRAWYTAAGHTKASYKDPLYRQHVLGGLRWVLGASSAYQ